MMEGFGESVKKLLLAGIGAAATTAEKSKELLDDMVEKGELTVEQGKALNEELKHNIKKTVKENVNVSVKPTSPEELDELLEKMTPEQILYYSPNCFGTADAISFRGDMLRIHDLKTGESPTHMEQLMIYAALFCLEYNYKPNEIQMELRIYQNDGIICHQPTIEDIFPIMDRIITFDKIINSIKEEE